MISKLFKKPTPDDMLDALLSPTFVDSKVESMLQHIDINHKTQDGKNFLHLIIPENKIESVKWLISKNIDINYMNAKGETPLMIACKYGYNDTIEALLKYDADVNLETHKGLEAIDFAILNDHFNAYKKIKSRVTNINRKTDNNITLLHRAIKAQSFKIIEDLFNDENFEVSKDVMFYKHTYENTNILNTVLSKFDDLNIKDSKGRNVLFYVVENGSKGEQVFLTLVSNGLDLDCIDENGDNILFHLIRTCIEKEHNRDISVTKDSQEYDAELYNLLDLIPIIIERGIDITACNKDNETIISYAAKNKSLKVLTILFDNEVDTDILNDKNETALSEIITKGSEYTEVIHLLLDYGTSPNIKDDEGRNVIEKVIDAHLIVNNHKKVKATQKRDISSAVDYFAILASVLVNTDANLTALNSKGEPYFFEALRYGNIDLIKLLIKHGADVNQVDKEGVNIIYKYMSENQTFKKNSDQKDYYANLRSIIMMGANVNAKDSYGGITLHKAILDCDTTTIKTLLHSGADINAIDNRGRNMVHTAIWKNDTKVFKLIYAYNKNLLNEPDKYGVLPINYAAFLGYTDMVLDLIEIGSQINNPHIKRKYIINFLKKFHKNLKTLVDGARTKAQKSKILMLIENMKKEFEVED